MGHMHWTVWVLLIAGWGSLWAAILYVILTIKRLPRLLMAGWPQSDLSVTAMAKLLLLLTLSNSVSHGFAILEWLQIQIAKDAAFSAPMNYTLAHLLTNLVTISYCVTLRRAARIGGGVRELVE